MASSIYAPLQSESREFRLLILEPSTDCLAPVQCKLSLASFDDGDLKYKALSYVWGDPLETTPVLVNGIETQVTLNLEAALRHIRKATCPVVLWVDALCINQEDETEKNHQVEMMREIYSGAELVIAWLGIACEDSDLAMEFFRRGFKDWMAGRKTQSGLIREDGLDCEGSSMVNDKHRDNTRARDNEEYLTTPSDENSNEMLRARIPGLQLSIISEIQDDIEFTGPLLDLDDDNQDEARFIDYFGGVPRSRRSNRGDSDVSDSSLDSGELLSEVQSLTTRESLAMYRLLTRSWWFRIWVVQEVFLAKMVLFKCGDAEVPGYKMSGWTSDQILLAITLILNRGHFLNNKIVPALSLLTNLHEKTVNLDTTMDYLRLYGMREATRPHDHIYGLLGIIPQKDRLLLGTPDYGCRVEDLFIGVVTKLMVEHNSLELLLQAGIPPPQAVTTPTKVDLPSWVPDWTRTWVIQQDHGVFRGTSDFSDSLSDPLFHFSNDAKELVVEGFEFHVIESVKLVPTHGQGKMPIWPADLATKECAAGQELPHYQKLLVALFLGDSGFERLDFEEGFHWVAAFLRELEEYRILLGRREASDGHDQNEWLAGFLEWTGETRDNRTDEEILEKIFSVEAARSFVKWYHREPSEKLQRFYFFYTLIRQGLMGTAGCSMFRTYKGAFGIMQAAAAAGDILYVVPSCPVMLALRKTESSKYLLVGPSSPIAGTLHGEVAQAVARGEITKESFTLV